MLMVPNFEFLDYAIDENGLLKLHTSQSKVTEVQFIVSFIYYYANFFYYLFYYSGNYTDSLYNLLKKNVPFVFDNECRQLMF